MGNLLSTARVTYRKVTPAIIRGSKFMTWVKQFGPHDLIYDEAYYLNTVEPSAAKGASVMALAIVRDIFPRNVIDVGCGTGALLAALREQGCSMRMRR